MNSEYKQLLIKDLSGRLPYRNNVRLMVQEFDEDAPSTRLLCTKYIDDIETDWLLICKPYLRQMDSMTEEECDMVEIILGDENIFDFMRNGDIILKEGNFTQFMLSRLYDYFNSIHVDYRGLIPKGLALEAPEGMYLK